jgi:hypothetical protein
MGHAARLLRISLLGIAVYVVSFYLFTSYFDLIGPGLASICAMLLTLGLNIRLVKGLR